MRRSLEIAFLGEKYVGKTTLIKNIVNEKTGINTYLMTLVVSKTPYIINVPSDDGMISYDLRLTDTPGQATILWDNIETDIDAVVLMYDISSITSFDILSSWLTSMFSKNIAPRPLLIVGNKSDRENLRMVFPSQVEAFIDRFVRPRWQYRGEALPISHVELSARYTKTPIINDHLIKLVRDTFGVIDKYSGSFDWND